MKYVDQVSITVEGGHGGPGASSFRREKYVPRGGPDGGNGGRGGHVIIQASHTLQTLMDLRLKRRYKAEPGSKGHGKDQTGANGKDVTILVPVGTMVTDEYGEIISDLISEGQKFIVARGGRGGLGNAKFSTSTNRAPRFAQPGCPGDEKSIQLELKLLAEVGLIGLPNAGKSTLLKTLTHANPKIASYPFTTLYPNLGVLHFDDQEIVLADIPGLIEGASEGHGLGNQFLRHVERTRLLVHCVSVESGDVDACNEALRTVNQEIRLGLTLEKPMMLVFTKIDTVSQDFLDTLKAAFPDSNCHFISSISQVGILELNYAIKKAVNDAKPAEKDD